MKNGKYVVLKKKDYDRGKITMVEDAVVIRMKDRFAAPALQSYYDVVTNAIEVLEEIGAEVPEDLRTVQDYFFSATQAARSTPSQLPTP